MVAKGVEVAPPLSPSWNEILTSEALDFVAYLERELGRRRRELLDRRAARQAEIDAGHSPDFLPETAAIRQAEWQVAPTPADLQRRWVEITGPTDRKMMINALNSGADVFMADFEDANSPTWQNMVEGQLNLRNAVDGTISFTNPDGKRYELNETTATLLVRPRGWHLEEKHLCLDGRPVSASLFDFGLTFFHNAQKLIDKGSGPYFYLAKLESHLEARLWNDAFVLAQEALGIPQGTIRATVLIETILAAFEMEEILYELREHSAGLNAGRWDYIFSIIKKFRNRPELLLPDRAQITMATPFMRAYTELLVKSCHKRGAHAIGGMAAFIPSRRDPEVNEIALAKVREDKVRESGDGFDGTWVAHPDLVPTARAVFEKVLGDRPHQKERRREEVQVRAGELTNFMVAGGKITEAGLRTNINVALLYLESWLQGTGAAAIYNLMEDTATAEISRAQLWQWIHHPDARLDDGRQVTLPLCREWTGQELEKIEALVGPERFAGGQFDLAAQLFDQLISAEAFVEFLTLVAYEYLP
ncbi:MAG: malate synthase A [Chloroflexi bacterium]|nr:malate synthase A [Chloroflexota bacterium]MCI0577675.1 malate synthase A [Chloroflexota bacterium]MCI0648057.1 malate synthase A [Chloroflexota bacterium]MCI0732164.1 malate synthase A [Chloroflexota bacterium]